MPRSAPRPKPISGGQLQNNIIELGHTMGWKFAHFRSVQAKTKDGNRWMTPVGADGKGFPDLVCLHPERGMVLFREIKGEHEEMRPDQVKWGAWLQMAGCDWNIWRPSDWDDIIKPRLTFGRGR